MAYTDFKNNKYQKNALKFCSQKFEIKLDNSFILIQSRRYQVQQNSSFFTVVRRLLLCSTNSQLVNLSLDSTCRSTLQYS